MVAELPLEALDAPAAAVDAAAVPVAVGDLALGVAQLALLPLPARLTETLPATVLALAAAQERTDGQQAGLSVIAGLTVTLAAHTVAPPVTVARAPGALLGSALGEELHVVGGPVIVIERHEPVTFLQVELLHTLD